MFGVRVLAARLAEVFNSGDGGTYNLSGGSLYTSTTYVGYSGTGTFVQTGGSATAISSLYIGCN